MFKAQPPSGFVVEPSGLVREMERKPDLETRIRYGKVDVIPFGQTDSFIEIGVIPRPFDVEETPYLVDLTFLLETASSCLGRGVHQGQWHGAAHLQVYTDVN